MRVRTARSPSGGSTLPLVRTAVQRDDWKSVVASDTNALPEHAPEWLEAVCASGRYADATRYYEIGGRRFVLPLARRRGPAGVGGWL